MFCPPLRWCCVQGASRAPYFFSWLFKSGSWVFDLFVSFVQNLLQLHMHAVVFSPIQFLCILLLEDSTCKHCSTAAKGPGSQPVSLPAERLYTLILF